MLGGVGDPGLSGGSTLLVPVPFARRWADYSPDRDMPDLLTSVAKSVHDRLLEIRREIAKLLAENERLRGKRRKQGGMAELEQSQRLQKMQQLLNELMTMTDSKKL